MKDAHLAKTLERVTRLTVVDHRKPIERDSFGRVFEAWNIEIRADLQDDGQTLKLWVHEGGQQDDS